MSSQAQRTPAAAVIEMETAWIPLSDGCRLAARIWLPAGAEERPAGAILEYIPYRRRDLSRMRDEPMHRYFAEHGHASLRVDLRGSGDSSGLLEDEYTRQEWEDGVEAIAWIAAQPWCNGSVGMIGLSWGGFTALQIAALRPPALRAIITVGSTDDRYRDDMHFTGGCLIDDQMEWGTGFLCYLGLPPDPEVAGDEWRRMWLSRLGHLRPPVHRWLRHQWRDAYWRHGSICEDYGAIEAAVYAVGGWADGYSNAVFRRKGLSDRRAHRPAHRRRPLALLRHRAPAGTTRAARRPGARPAPRLRPAGGAGGGPPERRRARRQLAAGFLRRAEPDAP